MVKQMNFTFPDVRRPIITFRISSAVCIEIDDCPEVTDVFIDSISEPLYNTDSPISLACCLRIRNAGPGNLLLCCRLSGGIAGTTVQALSTLLGSGIINRVLLRV